MLHLLLAIKCREKTATQEQRVRDGRAVSALTVVPNKAA